MLVEVPGNAMFAALINAMFAALINVMLAALINVLFVVDLIGSQ